MSIGDLVMGAMGGGSPGQQINQALQGPQPGGGVQQPGSTQIPQQGGMAAPQATQSPPDLASLYVKLMQQSRNANDFDRNMALFAGGFKGPPGGADRLLNAVQPAQDPGAMLQNLMQIRQMQAMQNAGPAITQALTGGGAGGAQGGAAPSGGGGYGGLTPEVINSLPIDTRLKMLDQKMQSQIALGQQGAETRQKELQEAQEKAPAMRTQLDQMNTLAGQVAGTTNSDGTPALQSILSSSTKKTAAMKLMETDPKEAPGAIMSQIYAGQLTPEEQGVIQTMKTLDNQVYGEAFQSTGSRRTGQEVQNLRNGLSPLKNLNQSYDSYMKQFGQFQTQISKSIANNYGAEQNLDAIPDQFKFGADGKPLMDESYLPGGKMYEGRGGQWVNNPPKAAGGGFNYGSIPSGTVYTAPDGTQRTKQ